MRNASDKIVEKIKTRILQSIIYIQTWCCLRDSVKYIVDSVRPHLKDNIALCLHSCTLHVELLSPVYRHTLTIFITYWYSMGDITLLVAQIVNTEQLQHSVP